MPTDVAVLGVGPLPKFSRADKAGWVVFGLPLGGLVIWNYRTYIAPRDVSEATKIVAHFLPLFLVLSTCSIVAFTALAWKRRALEAEARLAELARASKDAE